MGSSVPQFRKTGYIHPTDSHPIVHPQRVTYEERLSEVRLSIQGIEEAARGLMKDPLFFDVRDGTDDVNLSEAKANVMLAVRHIEDARMRLGKVFQALNDGKSILPR